MTDTSIASQFTTGGLLVVAGGAIMAYLRDVPILLWGWFVNQISVVITVKSDDQAFQWVKEWMQKQEFISSLRRVDLDSTLSGELLSLQPSPGKHLFFIKRRPYWLSYQRSEDAKGGWDAKRSENFSLRTPGRNQDILRGFVSQVVEAYYQAHPSKTSSLYVFDEYWRSFKSYSSRALDSVILPLGEKERLVSDIENFIEAEDRYKNLGIPYHRGYLFHGLPGTGKTSLVSGLAAFLKMPIYNLNLRDFTDQSLQKVMISIPPKSVILFEDVDVCGVKTTNREVDGTKTTVEKKEAMFGVTLSGLLNVLDGFYAPSNVVYFLTTNFKDRLDSALLRPGRIDYQLEFREATEYQKENLYMRFFPNKDVEEVRDFVKNQQEVKTLAEMQNRLLALPMLSS